MSGSGGVKAECMESRSQESRSETQHMAAALPPHSTRPGRRRNARPLRCTSCVVVLAVLALAALCSTADAISVRRSGLGGTSQARRGVPADLVDRGPRPRHLPLLDEPVILDIVERQDPLNEPNGGDSDDDNNDNSGDSQDDESPSTTARRPTQTATRPSTRTSASETATGTASSDESDEPAPTFTGMPKVFDSNMGNNFTSPTCPDFINRFRTDTDFNECLPFSLLLQNSQAFFMQMSTPDNLQRILDYTCNVVMNHCEGVMNNYATQIRDDAHCGQDYRLGNPLVVSAYVGFQAYRPMYQAGCLRDNPDPVAGATRRSDLVHDPDYQSADAGQSNSSPPAKRQTEPDYCFIATTRPDAAAADNFIYSLPLGFPLPGASRPTCSTCLQKTMGFFAEAAANMSSPLSIDYPSAALQVNNGCGPNWVSANVKPIEGSGEAEDAAPTVPRSLILAGVMAAGAVLLAGL